ncbi:MAG: hypothetical protein JWN14_3996 [Chthonomonadales bacterium]|nr:hypothetical protein [Chthonomonadales bacterium]
MSTIVHSSEACLFREFLFRRANDSGRKRHVADIMIDVMAIGIGGCTEIVLGIEVELPSGTARQNLYARNDAPVILECEKSFSRYHLILRHLAH